MLSLKVIDLQLSNDSKDNLWEANLTAIFKDLRKVDSCYYKGLIPLMKYFKSRKQQECITIEENSTTLYAELPNTIIQEKVKSESKFQKNMFR